MSKSVSLVAGELISSISLLLKKVIDRLSYNLFFVYAHTFTAKIISDTGDLNQAYNLRKRIFGDILKWVHIGSGEFESDNYDKDAIHFGIFRGGGLLPTAG